MDHRDAYLSEVTVVIKNEFADTAAAAERLKRELGLEVDEVNEDDGVIDGTIDSGRVKELQSHECVNYVRVEFSYIADYPPGDPRDKDGAEEA